MRDAISTDQITDDCYEAAWNRSTMSSNDAASNTITVGIYTPPNHAPVDVAATLHSLISSGRARVDGSAVADGVPAYVLSMSGLSVGIGVTNGTYDVAKSDNRPLLLRTTVACTQGTCPETVQFQIYEHLPETPANLSLLNLSAQHPGAMVVNGGGTDNARTSSTGSNN